MREKKTVKERYGLSRFITDIDSMVRRKLFLFESYIEKTKSFQDVALFESTI